MASTFLIMEQVHPEPGPFSGQRFRIVEVMVTVDGFRSRLTNQAFPSIEQARAYVADPLANHRCQGTKSIDGGSASERVPCDGVRHPDGTITGGCGEPCSFIMQRGE